MEDEPSESEPELRTRLEKLEAEEREISALRRKLHDRLASFPNEVTEQHEREVSKQRRELHAQIDALRARLRELQGR
jgi:chromosomal replication initiation ATPase DnaA